MTQQISDPTQAQALKEVVAAIAQRVQELKITNPQRPEPFQDEQLPDYVWVIRFCRERRFSGMAVVRGVNQIQIRCSLAGHADFNNFYENLQRAIDVITAIAAESTTGVLRVPTTSENHYVNN
ncbi:MAG: hypothetical protein AAGF24_09050 [Cyanobacteria bacterium P01_H01_bin.121]